MLPVAGRIATAAFSILAVMLCLGASMARAETIDLSRLESEVKNPTVQIVMADQAGFCSGTIVASKADEKTGDIKTVILTAEHCITDSPYRNQTVSLPVYDKDDEVVTRADYVATVVRQGSDTDDLAILVLKDKTASLADRVARVESADVKLHFGEQVFAAGYALGRDLGVTEGRFNGREDYNFPSDSNETSYFRASPAIAGGNSGGGLYHVNGAGDFLLIGVADWKVGREPGTFGAYTPIDRVQKFLSDYDSKFFPEPKKK